MELVLEFRLRPASEVWRRCRLFGIRRWVTFLYLTHRRGSCSALVWRGKRVSPDITFVTGAFHCRPVDVAPGGDLQAEIAYYGSHPNSESHTEAICAKFVQDVVNGRAVAFKRPSVSDTRGLCVSPVGAVEGRKLHIIHDLTFAGNGYRSSVNGDTDFSVAPPCELGHVFADVCRRVLYLRQRLGVVAGVMLCRIDVKDAFARFPACC